MEVTATPSCPSTLPETTAVAPAAAPAAPAAPAAAPPADDDGAAAAEVYANLQRESDLTWELIAAMSKTETTDVHEMLCKTYESLRPRAADGAGGPAAGGGGDAAALSKYMFYPPHDVGELLDTLRITRILHAHEIVVGDEDGLPVKRPGSTARP